MRIQNILMTLMYSKNLTVFIGNVAEKIYISLYLVKVNTQFDLLKYSIYLHTSK